MTHYDSNKLDIIRHQIIDRLKLHHTFNDKDDKILSCHFEVRQYICESLFNSARFPKEMIISKIEEMRDGIVKKLNEDIAYIESL
jgi:hypothetical protein